MKKVTIKESDLKSLIRESIGKSLNTDGFTVEPLIPKTPRESGIQGIFGRYSEEVPNDILRYMRKNPKMILKRLMELYGDRFFEMVGDLSSDSRAEQGPLDEQITISNYNDDEDEESYEDYQMRSYFNTVVRPILDGEDFDETMETEIDFFKGPKRSFRGSIYIDSVVPETNDVEIDRKVAKSMLEFISKRLKYENYIGGVGFKNRGNLQQPFDKDF